MAWKSLAVSRNELDLNTVLSCGQSFRWNKSRQDEFGVQEWTGVFGHHAWTLKQDKDHLLYKVLDQNPFLSDHDSLALLRNYLQLDVPLKHLYSEWASNDPKFLTFPYEKAGGIRILKQDPIETIFVFICSANNNIGRITQMVEKLCRFYGNTICDEGDNVYYDFPLVEKLHGDEVEAKLRSEGFGYRAAYIVKSARIIVNNGEQAWIEGLGKMGYDGACKELQTLVGVGRKVADCVCLMGLGYHEAVPVDTHIFQVSKEYLPGLQSTKTLTDRVYTEISDHFRKVHGDYCGWAQSVLFTSRLKGFGAFDNNCVEEQRGKKRKRRN